MPKVFYRISNIICLVLKGVPIGTNKGLFHLIFAIISGRFLTARGGVFPALLDMGLDQQEIQRAGDALSDGVWNIATLVDNWQKIVQQEELVQLPSYEGYVPRPCDLTAFYRPRLQGLGSKHYHSQSKKAIPAVVFGLSVSVVYVGKQRLGIPTLILRGKNNESDAKLQSRLVRTIAPTLKKNDVAVFDAGFLLSDMLKYSINYVLRAAKNATARRNYLPEAKGKGRRSEYGEVIRPTPRTHKEKIIPATPPDKTETWIEGKHIIRAEIWENLVPANQKPGGTPFRMVAIHHPSYKEPLILETNLPISAKALLQIYYSRWPVELVPQTAKPILGTHHSSVHGKESRYRLPELALLSGSVLSYVAATEAPVATGFWDRVAQGTCGRLSRSLSQVNFSKLPLSLGEVREKRSRTDQLPKGAEARRLHKSAQVAQSS